MGITPQDRSELKASLLKIGQKEPEVLAEIFQEVVLEIKQTKNGPAAPVGRDTESLIQEIFNEYDEVFRALA